jgi:hypothetical protein
MSIDSSTGMTIEMTTIFLRLPRKNLGSVADDLGFEFNGKFGHSLSSISHEIVVLYEIIGLVHKFVRFLF